MAGETADMGTVYYKVDADTSDLVNKGKAADKTLEDMAKAGKRTDTAFAGLKTRMTETAKAARESARGIDENSRAAKELNKWIKLFLSAKTIWGAIGLSDEYGQMASRIRNATASAEEYVQVQERLLDVANGTYRSLAEAQEVYLSVSDALRDMGYNTSQVLDITESFSYAMVRDAARTDQATTAMDAYSKALMKGKIESDGWASIMAATPSIVKGIAQATGESEAAIKKLGATGKLSMEALNEGLRASREENMQLAEAMEVSVQDALNNLRNALQVFIGKVNESSEASGLLVKGIGEIADALKDPETIRAAQDFAIGIVTAINTIIDAARNVIGGVRWMAQTLAAFFHGVAPDDIVRIQDAIDKNQKLRDQAARVNNKERVAQYDAEIARLKQMESQWHQVEQNRQKAAQEEQKRQEQAKKDAASAPRKKVAARAKEDNSEAQAKKAASAAEQNRRVIEALRDAIDQTTMSAEELAAAQARARLNKLATPEDVARVTELADQLLRVQQSLENDATIRNLAQDLYLASLNGKELAQAQAAISLNQFATPEQVALVKELAGRLYDVNEATKEREKFGKTEKEQEEFIRGNVSPLSGGAFDEQYARYEQEAKAEQERYAKQQERLQQALDLGLRTREQYNQMEEQFAREHAQRMEQIEQAKNQNILASGQQMFSALAGAVEAYGGKASGAFRALFAISKAFAIAQATLNLSTAISQALADPTALTPMQKFANMAAVASAGAALVSQISSAGFGGGRQYGGNVSAGKFYRVNEGGAPEILNTNGRQYLMMNQSSGSVQPLSKSGAAGAAGPVNVYINISKDGVSTENTAGLDRFGKDIGRFVEQRFNEMLGRAQMQGGTLWKGN